MIFTVKKMTSVFSKYPFSKIRVHINDIAIRRHQQGVSDRRYLIKIIDQMTFVASGEQGQDDLVSTFCFTMNNRLHCSVT